MSPGGIDIKKAAILAFTVVCNKITSTHAAGELVTGGHFMKDIIHLADAVFDVDLTYYYIMYEDWLQYLGAIYLTVLHFVIFYYVVKRVGRWLSECMRTTVRPVLPESPPLYSDVAVQVELAPVVEGMTVDGLKLECRALGLRTSGLRADLEARVRAERERRSA